MLVRYFDNVVFVRQLSEFFRKCPPLLVLLCSRARDFFQEMFGQTWERKRKERQRPRPLLCPEPRSAWDGGSWELGRSLAPGFFFIGTEVEGLEPFF